ncbi:hypothetical protein KUCAC02_035635, partial [Chaenocephalus aceratus]
MSLLKEAEPGREMEATAQTWAHRKPKVLGCLHRVCAKCLKKMVDMGESSPSVISCPFFCRHETNVPDEEVRLYLRRGGLTNEE